MVALSLQNFGGELPKVDPHLLPQDSAALAQNTWLFSGAIEGVHGFTPIYTLKNPSTKRVFRLPYTYYDKLHFLSAYWMEFQNPYVDVIRSPTTNDTYERYYWASSKSFDNLPPYYNTKARIIAGQSPYLLGIPAPTVAPTVSVSSTPNTGLLESRAYVYTWVSAYGEEGAPSPPTVVNGYNTNTWTIGLTTPGSSVTTNRNIATTRIYRTVTATGGSTTYFFVAEIPYTQTSYTDTIDDTTVSGNNQLQSLYWTPPPSDLEGFVTMPNGIVASWRKNEIWFCEPYRPHAWPVAYQISVEYPIVGLGVTGQTLIVLTTGYPTAVTGISPATMAQSRIAKYEPCLSRGSILSAVDGVLYASPNGIILAFGGLLQNVTEGFIYKDKWLNLFNVPGFNAARIQGAIYGWGSPRPGCFEATAWQPTAVEPYDFTGSRSGSIIAYRDNRMGMTTLTQSSPMYNVFEDAWTGEVLVIHDGTLYWLDPAASQARLPFVWRSKIFTMPNRRNMEAMRVWWNIPDGLSITLGTQNTNLVQTFNPTSQYAIARVYADDTLVLTRELRTSGELIRLPSGFKATHWQVEIEGQIQVYQIEVSTSARELQNV